MKKMGKKKDLMKQIFMDLKCKVKYEILRFRINIGMFDEDSKLLLNRFYSLWYLSNQSELTFNSFLNYQNATSKKRMDSYNNRYYNNLGNVLFAFLPSFVLILLIIIIPYPISKMLLFISFSLVLVITYISTVIIISRKPTERKLTELQQYINILDDYSKKKRPIGILNTSKVISQYSRIKLPYSSSEIASFLFFLSRNKDSKGIVISHITSFIKRNCIKTDGSSYNNLDSLISKCDPLKSDINPYVSYDNFTTKLKQIDLD